MPNTDWIASATLPELKRAGIENHILGFRFLGMARLVSEGIVVITEKWLVDQSDEYFADLDAILAEIKRREASTPYEAQGGGK